MHRGAGQGDLQAPQRAPRKQGLRAGRHAGDRRHHEVSGGGGCLDKAGSGWEVPELASSLPLACGQCGAKDRVSQGQTALCCCRRQARCPGGGRLPLWMSMLPWRGSASAVDKHAALVGVGFHCGRARGPGGGQLPL